MPFTTHGLRHDTEALFARLLRDEKWLMTPCVVITEVTISVVRDAKTLLTFLDDRQIICGWPGAKRQDVFEFTVGQYRSYVEGRDHTGGQGPMTACDEKCVDDPKADTEVGATEENVKADAAESDAAAEAKPEGECAASSEACGHAPAAQPTEQAAE